MYSHRGYLMPMILTGLENSSGTRASALPLLSSKVHADLQQQLKQNLRGITKQYASYVRCLRMTLNEKDVSARDLRDFLLSLSAFENSTCQDQELLLSKRALLEKASDIDGIFEVLQKYFASFLDCEIFETIMEEFNISKDQEKLRYSDHLKNYIDKHKLYEFHEINPLLKDFTDDSVELILKFDLESCINLGELKDITAAVANILNLRPSALRLLRIEEGCILVVMLISIVLARALFNSDTVFSSDQRKRLVANSVLWLECNDRIFYFNKAVIRDNISGNLVLSMTVLYIYRAF